jgi:hypothetical protein
LHAHNQLVSLRTIERPELVITVDIEHSLPMVPDNARTEGTRIRWTDSVTDELTPIRLALKIGWNLPGQGRPLELSRPDLNSYYIKPD